MTEIKISFHNTYAIRHKDIIIIIIIIIALGSKGYYYYV